MIIHLVCGVTGKLLRRPAEYIPAFEEALREASALLTMSPMRIVRYPQLCTIIRAQVIQTQDPSYLKATSLAQVKIGVHGAFGSHHVSPRGALMLCACARARARTALKRFASRGRF